MWIFYSLVNVLSIKHVLYITIHFTIDSLCPSRPLSIYTALHSFILALGTLGLSLREEPVPSSHSGGTGHRPMQQPGQFLAFLFA